MKIDELKYANFINTHLKPYAGRAQSYSSQFILWFLENVFRLDEQFAIDAVVDDPLDKGVDAIFVDEAAEAIYIFQSKLISKEKGTIPEVEVKNFSASLQQFTDAGAVQKLIDGNANQRLKDLLHREKIQEKLSAGFSVQGIFCSNVAISDDAKAFLENVKDIEVYDAKRICEEHIDIEYDGGIKKTFAFDTSDTDVIKYETGEGVISYIFLASALQLVHLDGISDGSLFERNVRLALGNTKVNKGLVESIEKKKEHKNFPLYHNGINIICDSATQSDEGLKIKNYTVVNGAQSLTSLYNKKSKLTDDLKIVVKVVAINNDVALADKITNHSNNQNAIKARDLKSNHGIQQRLKSEVESSFGAKYSYEVKRGEKVKNKIVIVNEDVGLYILAMDLGQPYSCHQKYKVMDELHGDIFGRPSVDAVKIVTFYELGQIAKDACGEIDNKPFANYTLTKYFVAHLAWSLFSRDGDGSKLIKQLAEVHAKGSFPAFAKDFDLLARTAALDLNAVFETAKDEGKILDYKTSMKNVTWSIDTTTAAITSYRKSVLRKQAESISAIAKRYLA